MCAKLEPGLKELGDAGMLSARVRQFLDSEADGGGREIAVALVGVGVTAGLEAFDRDLLTRRDVERLFDVSWARAAQLMREFGAELAGHSRVLRRTGPPGRPLYDPRSSIALTDQSGRI